MKKKYFLILIFLIIPVLSFSQSWIQKNSLFNYGRYSAIGCEANGKGYAGMGQNEDGTYLDDFWEYDPALNNWKRKADFPGIGRYGASAHSIKGKIYVCFGYDDLRVSRNNMWEYNPENDENGNDGSGEAVIIDSKNSYIYSETGLIALVGLDDVIVVQDGNTTLVCKRDKAEEIKKVVDKLKAENKNQYL